MNKLDMIVRLSGFREIEVFLKKVSIFEALLKYQVYLLYIPPLDLGRGWWWLKIPKNHSKEVNHLFNPKKKHYLLYDLR